MRNLPTLGLRWFDDHHTHASGGVVLTFYRLYKIHVDVQTSWKPPNNAHEEETLLIV